MGDQHEPITEVEFVYRRIPAVFDVPTLPFAVKFPAFRPNAKDVSGVSLFRAKFISPADTIAILPLAKRASYCVARLAVRDLLALGLTVIPEPVPTGPAGHAVVPELCWSSYEANKQGLKPVLLARAALASNDIILAPT